MLDLYFTGLYDPKLTYSLGDVCILDGKTCVFNGTRFLDIGETSNSSYDPPKKIVYGVCKHCGAPLNDEKCEYCGVRNKSFAEERGLG